MMIVWKLIRMGSLEGKRWTKRYVSHNLVARRSVLPRVRKGKHTYSE